MSESENVTRSSAASVSSSQLPKRNSDDIGWEYGFMIKADNKDRVQCKLCGKQMGSGVTRIKKHIAQIKGDVTSCPKATKEDIAKCKDAIAGVKQKREEKQKDEKEVRAEVDIFEDDIMEEDMDIQILGTKKRPHFLGPIDKFASAIKPDLKKMKQQNISDALFKERTHSVHQYVARWVYESGIPFNAVDNDSFKQLCEAIGQFGPGYHPSSQYQLREPLLKEEVARTKKLLKKQEDEWALTGCSMMTDAWSDRKRRSIMNVCVNCKHGTTFISSKEDSEASHTGEYIFSYVDRFIDEIGPQQVVQVVTDNASNNMAAAVLLKEKRPHIFWTSCATHTLNLMLEGIGKRPRFKGIIDKAKAFTIFIYAHHNTLAMMRKATKRRDIVRPGVTRFATSFLTLQSLVEKKEELRKMFTSNEWASSKWANTVKGRAAYATVISSEFWSGVTRCLKVFAPLVKVLRLVDGDWKPSMGFVYGELKQAKLDMRAAFKPSETRSYEKILEIIAGKGDGRLDTPLHMTAYMLNPFYYYNNSLLSSFEEDEQKINDGILECVEHFYPNNFDVQNEVYNIELLKYKNKEGAFGKQLAAKGCEKNDEKYDPVGWWTNYGHNTPNLKKMAIRILSLTSSSSGCERNWSTFEGIHTKKRNRLDASRLNNLVYVQFNARLINKKKRGKEKDVLLANDASKAQSWIVEGEAEGVDGDEEEVEPGSGSGLTWNVVSEAMGANEFLQPRRSGRNVREQRELHDEDFESDEEGEVMDEEEFDFESDDDRAKEGYGEEEEEINL